MTQPILRRAQHGDIDATLSFWRDAAAPGSHHDHAAVQRLIRHDPDALLLAVENDAIVGTVIAAWDGWRYHLYRVAVREDRRRRGIAAALVEHAERRAVSVGAPRADALVLEANTVGQAAWAALGYARQDHLRRWAKSLPPAP